VKLADRIRAYGRQKYVLPARKRRVDRFSIRAGDVVQELRIGGSRAPAVCSALKTHQFLRENHLHLVEATGPKSGQSTTVTYTYEFVDQTPLPKQEDSWAKLRGAFKDVFAEFGGGEAYLREERSNFYPPQFYPPASYPPAKNK
jgi:hypothetical protein